MRYAHTNPQNPSERDDERGSRRRRDSFRADGPGFPDPRAFGGPVRRGDVSGERHHHEPRGGDRRGFGDRHGSGERPRFNERPGFGDFGPGFRGPRRGERRAGRGDVRIAILLLLSEQPMHGYQLIQEIGERSGGVWRPSPGAVYPALNLLQDEGLVELGAESGRRLASLTEAGTAYVTDHADELVAPWSDAATTARRPRRELRDAAEALAAAVGQVARTGDDAQVAATVDALARTRREIYLVLAGEVGTGTPGADPDADDAVSES